MTKESDNFEHEKLFLRTIELERRVREAETLNYRLLNIIENLTQGKLIVAPPNQGGIPGGNSFDIQSR